MQLVSTLRAIAGTRALSGRPDRLLARPAGAFGTGVLRFLGARQLVQALVVRRTGWHALSAGVDLLHGGSMLLLLAAPRWRRFAAGQAATAGVLVALELLTDRR